MYPKDRTFHIKVRKNIIDEDEFIRMPVKEKENLLLLKGHMHFGLHQYFEKPYTYITFLREPVGRLVSYYNYILRDDHYGLRDRIHSEYKDFYDWVDRYDRFDIHNGQTRMISGNMTDHPDMLEAALENIENHFTFVGTLKKFDESLVILKRMFEWKVPYYFVLNKTSGPIMRHDLDQKIIDLIKERNSFDYELYNHITAKLNEQISKEKLMNMSLLQLKLYKKAYSSSRIRVAAKLVLGNNKV